MSKRNTIAAFRSKHAMRPSETPRTPTQVDPPLAPGQRRPSRNRSRMGSRSELATARPRIESANLPSGTLGVRTAHPAPSLKRTFAALGDCFAGRTAQNGEP